MKLNKSIQAFVAVLLIVGIVFSINFGMAYEAKASLNTVNYSMMMYQTATVPCKDTPNWGDGQLFERICVKDMVRSCEWDNYKLPANDGECEFGDPGEN